MICLNEKGVANMGNTIKLGNYTFEVIDHVPNGYQIWNIGKNMIDGYLPLCRLIGNSYNVDATALKAIKCEGAQTILAAVGGGQNTIKQMESYIKRYKNAKAGTVSFWRKERILKALPYMKMLDWQGA